MNSDEKNLKTCLNFSNQTADFYIRADVLLWFKERFLDYYKKLDEIENSNYIEIIKQLYLRNEKRTLDEIAAVVGIHVRTLQRYRKKFVLKMKELIEESKSLNLEGFSKRQNIVIYRN